ncbi:MAG: hemin uptake protein HemP [Xanthomonadales bacterium]|nr:hemin uptake protein HemP [Xanthomonadales bacterium]
MIRSPDPVSPSGSTGEGESVQRIEALPALPVLDAERLLGGGREVGIRLGEALYRLRITRKGRLILTK